jgi:hypothetical protein
LLGSASERKRARDSPSLQKENYGEGGSELNEGGKNPPKQANPRKAILIFFERPGLVIDLTISS